MVFEFKHVMISKRMVFKCFRGILCRTLRFPPPFTGVPEASRLESAPKSVFGVAQTVLLAQTMFLAPAKKGPLFDEDSAKMTNLHSTHSTEHKGFAPQTPENDENGENGGCHSGKGMV